MEELEFALGVIAIGTAFVSYWMYIVKETKRPKPERADF